MLDQYRNTYDELMNDLHKSKFLVRGLLVVFCMVWFYGLGARTLVPTDEGRYAEMAREMVTTNDWITPRLNAIKYFEKPPLQTWMNALTFKLFGLGEWQARLWTGLCGLLGIALVAYTGGRVFNQRVGFTAALVLASSIYWAAMGHINALDMGLAAMMAVSLCALLMAQRNDASTRERRNWMMACWTGMALAVLSKGLIGVVLPGAVLVLYTLLSRDRAIWKRLHLGPGLLVFFALTAPWFILVSLANPEFPQFFFIHEHFQRFTSKIHNRAGPWYYFIPILVLGIMPWLGVLVQSLWSGRHDEEKGFQPKKLLLIWSGFIFFFFSISGSKLPSYILPIFPALALLIACELENASHKTIAFAAGLLALVSAIGLAFVPKIPALGRESYAHPLYQSFSHWVAAAAILMLAGSLLAIWLARRQKQWAILVLAGTGFIGGQILMLGHDPLGRYSAGVLHVPAIQAELTPQTPIYAVGRYEQVLPFYLRRTFILVEHADEMAFGLQHEPNLWLPTRDAFIAVWNAEHANGKKAVAILDVGVYADFLKRGVPMRIIAQDPRRVIVTNDVKK
jgi:4-amino-4-deoxy-L-arabinose transferase-like glycosyltransferase